MSSDDEDFNDIYGEEPKVEEPKKSVTETEAPKQEEKKDDSNPISQLDQLAALQALSSNLNQISSKSNDSNDSSDKKESSANDSTTSNTNNTSTSNNIPTGLPWDQLQQTMSQFQQQQPQQPQQETQQQRNVKADISKDNCKMFIGGLNWETTEDGLRDYFSKYGHVIDLKIMKDSNTGRSRGFGFLTFDQPSSVDEVVKTQHILDGKVIDPKRSIPREEQDKTGKIFVGGIGADVRPKEFEEFFATYGNIIDAQLMLDKDTGRSRGFGFVTYDSPEAVDRVCQSKYIEFKGKQIEIKRAEPRHMQKGQYGGANPNNLNNQNSMSNANPMYQNPMAAQAANPMFNPQAMTDYYQKMQEYYTQMQQQTGIDYSQMYQQQMQQMAMMMPGFAMPGMPGAPGMPGQGPVDMSGDNTQVDSNNTNVQTIGDDSSDSKDKDSATPDISLPRGPRDSRDSSSHGSNHHSGRDNRGGNYRGNRGGNYRNDRNGGNGNYRGGRGGGYNRRRDNGYHPYNR